MNWQRFVIAVLVSGLVVSTTDWLFSGVLFHSKYLAYPEVWRSAEQGFSESRAVGTAILLVFLTCAVFTHACIRLNVHGLGPTVLLAILMWIALCLPIIVSDGLFLKLHPLVTVSHLLPWITKLVVLAITVTKIIR